MQLALGRLSQGACGRTLAGAPDFALSDAGRPVLSPDRVAYAELVSQLSMAVAPPLLAPVTTGGPIGFDVALDTGVTGISQHAGYWRRGTRGADPPTCDGRNGGVASNLAVQRVRFTKGLPLGLSIGGNAGYVHGIGAFTFGTELKLAILEGEPRAPSLAIRVASSSLVGATELTLSTFAFDVLLSRAFPVMHRFQVVPYAAVGALLSYAKTDHVDLTPNIDAVACAAGRDAVCNAEGLGGSTDDFAHDRAFPRIWMARYRAVLGFWLRWRMLGIAAETAFDLRRPGRASRELPAAMPRQWSFQFAPSVTF